MSDWANTLRWVKGNVWVVFLVVVLLTYVVPFPPTVLGIILLAMAGLVGWAVFADGINFHSNIDLAYAAFTTFLALEGIFMLINEPTYYKAAWAGSLVAMIAIFIVGSGSLGSGGRYRAPLR
jgi:hypothetical protein